jgi:hypothetical protein
MNERAEEINEIKKLFSTIIKSKITVKENIDDFDKKQFIILLERLEEAYNVEKKIFDSNGLDLYNLTDPLWDIIADFVSLYYGENACELIFWFIFKRFDEKGNIIKLEGLNDQIIEIKTPEDIWFYLNKILPPKEDLDEYFDDENDEEETENFY